MCVSVCVCLSPWILAGLVFFSPPDCNSEPAWNYTHVCLPVTWATLSGFLLHSRQSSVRHMWCIIDALLLQQLYHTHSPDHFTTQKYPTLIPHCIYRLCPLSTILFSCWFVALLFVSFCFYHIIILINILFIYLYLFLSNCCLFIFSLVSVFIGVLQVLFIKDFHYFYHHIL